MIRPLSICLLACCEIVLAASQPQQKTSMEGSRANRSQVTIEGLVRDMACPIQNLDGNGRLNCCLWRPMWGRSPSRLALFFEAKLDPTAMA